MGRIYCSPCLQAKDRTKKLSLLVLLAVISMSLLTLLISGILTLSIFKRDVPSVQSMDITSSTDTPNIHYGIVIDCGSSGSRVYVYNWPPHSGNPSDLLNIQQLIDHEGKPVMKKVSPGLSEFDDNPDDASEHIKKLLEYVVGFIPKEKHKETPLYILATAGMRMISKEAQEAILKDLLKDVTKDFDFLVADNHFEVISGKLEGVYAWIAVNYALDRFAHTTSGADVVGVKLSDGKVHRRSRTVGMIDMGGGSVQIAYEVTDAAQMQKIPSHMIAEFNLGCQETDVEHTYRVYVTTFLGYGANSAIDRYQTELTKNSSSKSRSVKRSRAVPDPCLPPGMPLTVEADDEHPLRSFIGTGDYADCKSRLEPLLNLSVPCPMDPCSMNGVHQPEIDFFSSQFYGFSEFWYSMEDVYRMGGVYKFPTFEKKAMEFCSTSWTQLDAEYKEHKYPKADDHRFKYECIKSAWMSAVLHKGFQFPTSYPNFQSAQLIKGKDVQWTLGALIYRTRFLPLRDIGQDLRFHSPPWIQSRIFYNEYLIVLCFVVVLAAIFLYMKRLRLCPRRGDLSRVPSMSYFMTEENQMEQGVRYVNGQGYL